MKVSKVGSKRLIQDAGGARIVRFEKRGGSQFDYEDTGVPARIAGWRPVDRVTTSYLVFEGGSQLHPNTAESIEGHGDTLAFDFGLTRITYTLKNEGD